MSLLLPMFVLTLAFIIGNFSEYYLGTPLTNTHTFDPSTYFQYDSGYQIPDNEC